MRRNPDSPLKSTLSSRLKRRFLTFEETSRNPTPRESTISTKINSENYPKAKGKAVFETLSGRYCIGRKGIWRSEFIPWFCKPTGRETTMLKFWASSKISSKWKKDIFRDSLNWRMFWWIGRNCLSCCLRNKGGTWRRSSNFTNHKTKTSKFIKAWSLNT